MDLHGTTVFPAVHETGAPRIFFSQIIFSTSASTNTCASATLVLLQTDPSSSAHLYLHLNFFLASLDPFSVLNDPIVLIGV